MTDKLLAPAVCPKCGDPFTPIPRRDGSLPPACGECVRSVNWFVRRAENLVSLQHASAAKKRNARVRVQQQLWREFGQLSDREAALFAAGVGVGYARGYNAMYHAQHRRRPA